MDLGEAGKDYLHLTEFSYNNNSQTSIGIAPFEILYGRKYRFPLCWDNIGDSQLFESFGFVDHSVLCIKFVWFAIGCWQHKTDKKRTDQHRRPLEFRVGDHVFLRIFPTWRTVRFENRRKLSP